MVVKGFIASVNCSELIQLNMTVGRKDKEEVLGVHSQDSNQSNTPVESGAVALKRLEAELEMRRLQLAYDELAVQTQLKDNELDAQTQAMERKLEVVVQTQLKQREIEVHGQN